MITRHQAHSTNLNKQTMKLTIVKQIKHYLILILYVLVGLIPGLIISYLMGTDKTFTELFIVYSMGYTLYFIITFIYLLLTFKEIDTSDTSYY